MQPRTELISEPLGRFTFSDIGGEALLNSGMLCRKALQMHSKVHLVRRVFRMLATIAAVAFVTALDHLIHVNSATAAFTFLLLILGLATRVGLEESIAASLVSMLAYNFYFLPPVGTLTIADPQNWVALFVF